MALRFRTASPAVPLLLLLLLLSALACHAVPVRPPSQSQPKVKTGAYDPHFQATTYPLDQKWPRPIDPYDQRSDFLPPGVSLQERGIAIGWLSGVPMMMGMVGAMLKATLLPRSLPVDILEGFHSHFPHYPGAAEVIFSNGVGGLTTYGMLTQALYVLAQDLRLRKGHRPQTQFTLTQSDGSGSQQPPQVLGQGAVLKAPDQGFRANSWDAGTDYSVFAPDRPSSPFDTSVPYAPPSNSTLLPSVLSFNETLPVVLGGGFGNLPAGTSSSNRGGSWPVELPPPQLPLPGSMTGEALRYDDSHDGVIILEPYAALSIVLTTLNLLNRRPVGEAIFLSEILVIPEVAKDKVRLYILPNTALPPGQRMTNSDAAGLAAMMIGRMYQLQAFVAARVSLWKQEGGATEPGQGVRVGDIIITLPGVHEP